MCVCVCEGAGMRGWRVGVERGGGDKGLKVLV